MNTNSADIASLILQILSFQILLKDFNNADLMNELQHQDRNYFEKILRNQQEIIKLLTKGSDENGRRSN